MILYKYFSPDRDNIILTPRVRFTPPYAFNDIFECFPAIDRKSANEWLIQEEIWPGIVGTIGSSFSQSWLAAVLACVRPVLAVFDLKQAGRSSKWLQRKLKHPTIDTVASDFGVFCLSAVPDSQLMWAHYAANHQGFAVGFDSDHPFFGADAGLGLPPVSPVHYSETRPTIDFRKPVLDMTFLLTKPKEWAYEQEYRLIRRLSDADATVNQNRSETVHLFNVPPEAIREVIFGIRASPELRESMARRIAKRGFPIMLFDASLSRTHYAISLRPNEPNHAMQR